MKHLCCASSKCTRACLRPQICFGHQAPPKPEKKGISSPQHSFLENMHLVWAYVDREHSSCEKRCGSVLRGTAAPALNVLSLVLHTFGPQSWYFDVAEQTLTWASEEWGEYRAAHNKMHSTGRGRSYYKISKVIFTGSGVVFSAFLHLSAQRLGHNENCRSTKASVCVAESSILLLFSTVSHL